MLIFPTSETIFSIFATFLYTVHFCVYTTKSFKKDKNVLLRDVPQTNYEDIGTYFAKQNKSLMKIIS